MDPILAELRADVKAVLVTQVKHTALLDEHMRRTANLEARVKPLEDAVVARAGMGKFAAWCVGLLSAGATVIEILHRLKVL